MIPRGKDPVSPPKRSSLPSGRSAKVTIPSLPRLLRRPRLVTLLDRLLTHRVVWVTGPPGAGKTTLVASYLKSRRRPAAWLRLDEGDADLSSFVHYMTVAVNGRDTRRGPPLPALTPDVGPGAAVFLRRFLERLSERLPRRSVIVLDNYHEVPERAPLHAWLPDALSDVAANVRVIIISRAPPPPAFAPLDLHGDLARVPAAALDLTAAEQDALVTLHRPRVSKATRRAYRGRLELACGWMAGAILLLDHDPHTATVDADGSQGPLADVFAYLTSHTLDAVPVAHRRFLLETSLLPEFTSEIARAVTGASFAADYLEELHRARFFTERTDRGVPWYRYHPLFKSALSVVAERELPAARIAEVRGIAGRALVRAGLVEAGVAILTTAGDWTALIGVLVDAAPALVGEGRVATLAAWIDGMPSAIVETHPWMRYWRALCDVAVGAPNGFRAARGAAATFDAAGDSLGAIAARSLIVIAQVNSGGSLAVLDEELERLPDRPEDLPEMPAELERQVTDAIATALIWRQPGSPRTASWASHALELRGATRGRSAAVPFPYAEQRYLWQGEPHLAREAFRHYKRYVRALELPSSALACAYADAVLFWNVGEADACRSVIEHGLAASRREGLPMWEHLLSTQAVYNELFAGQTAAAMEYLARLRATPSPRGGYLQLHLDFLEAWARMQDGDLTAAWALIHPERGRPEIGAGVVGLCLTSLARTYVSLALGESRAASEFCDDAQAAAESMNSDMMRHGAAFARAACEFADGDDRHGDAALEAALVMGRRRGIWGCPGWNAREVARLVSRALAAGIEPDYARELLRRRWLPRPDRAVMAHEWPWPVEIRAFGDFEVRRAGKLLSRGRKSPHRVLALLRAIIVLGGVDVPVTRLCDWLWPDADGDVARENLDKTLQRLRRLLEQPQCVSVRGGRVSLDRDLVWVDAIVFEELARRQDSRSRAEALTLSRGPLFGSMPVTSLEQGYREKLERMRRSLER